MRQILVDAARKRTAEKRTAEEVDLSEIPDLAVDSGEGLLAMNEALERLEREDALKARLIEMRYFGGMTAEESAAALGMSVHVARRELRIAQAWLRREVGSK